MNFIDFINEADLFSLFLKLFGVVVGALYLFFSVVMVKQVETMKRTITIQDNGLLDIVAYVQVLLSFIALVFALFIL